MINSDEQTYNIMSFKPKTKKELRKAIEEYCENDEQKYGNINDWDVNLITNMSRLFYCCNNFYNCNKKIHHFNQPINNWNVSNVINMSGMFYCCYVFNQPINNWNVSNVVTMSYMFYRCEKFNQPINNWDVSNVTNMSSMFCDCYEFNQPLNNWNVSKVDNMNYMFSCCHVFNQPINNWNFANFTDMNSMFYKCENFNKTYKEQFYMININKRNKCALNELQKDISIIKIYYMSNDKEFIMDNIDEDNKNKIQQKIFAN